MQAFASDVSFENQTQTMAYSLDGVRNSYAPIGKSFVMRVKAARGKFEFHEDGERDSHHPSCCGACDECLRICWGYHGPERRSGSDRRVAFPEPSGGAE